MAQIDADGINGDTQDGVPLAFFQAAEKIGHPLAFQPEGSPHDEAVGYNLLTWGEYKFQFVPAVDRFKWLETRHMVNISDRWNRDKNDDLQFAFFNGVGWESWENIWAGMESHLGMRKLQDVWLQSSGHLLPSSAAQDGSRFTQHLLMAFSPAGGLLTKPLCGRWSTETNTS
jgi:hypothetical protein